jgi:hypothetical protein
MDNYYLVKELLGLNNGNLPVHRGMRQKRYESIDKMLDLLDVVQRIRPKLPTNVLYLDPSDPEWEDDMNYMHPNYELWRSRFSYFSLMFFLYIYNYQIIAHNAHWRFLHKVVLTGMIYYTSRTIFNYRKDVLRANLFDEYVQLRADELIEQHLPNLKSEAVKKYIWYELDLTDTLGRSQRQSYLNTSEDFKDAELILQDFIRRYTDETQPLPLTTKNALIGHKSFYL